MSWETVESWDSDLEGHDPIDGNPYWRLEFEYDDGRVHPMDLYCDGERVDEKEHDEVWQLMIELAYAEMKDSFAHPSSEFSGAWALLR